MHDGTYPKHHYWGTDVLLNSKDFNSRFAKSKILYLPDIVSKFINRKIFNGYSDLNNEWNAFHVAKSSDYLYSVCGPLSSIAFYNKCKIISWVFQVNKTNSNNPLDPYHPKNLRKHAGFLCLTPKAEKYYSKFAPSKFIPWCVDLNMFDGKRTKLVSTKPFFLASGKTGRDYDTLVNAANYTNAEIRIIGPRNQKPKFIPDNVLWIETSIDPPDQAIDYPTLKKWYAQSSGVCIPLTGNANDTCGYTNMLEAMAMRKPVLMTRSGCLHIDPASRKFGMLIEPHDAQNWASEMNRIVDNPDLANELGAQGRKIAKEEFSIERFNRDVVSFIKKILNNNE